MAKILILGGGFGGVVAAESLADQLGDEHQITLISRSRDFVFYPALVRLAFGRSEPDDIAFDLRKTMLSRRINFVEAEVARLDLDSRRIIISHGEVEGNIPYDYLIFALGRRLATERVTGFFEHSHHLLNLEGALRFKEALNAFRGGHIVVGQCAGARLPVPAYETAFALSRHAQKNDWQGTKITIVGPGTMASEFGDYKVPMVLAPALERHGIEHVPNFPISHISSGIVMSTDGRDVDHNLLMLLPPFSGAPAASRLGLTNEDGYINVDWHMRVTGAERVYAAGDCVNFDGPKMGHMAVRQGEVAAANLAAEISGDEPVSYYNHEAMMVIDAPDGDSIYFQKDFWSDEPGKVRQGRFWSWAKRVHERYWEASRS